LFSRAARLDKVEDAGAGPALSRRHPCRSALAGWCAIGRIFAPAPVLDAAPALHAMTAEAICDVLPFFAL